MASRVAEVLYRLRDLFTGPAKRIGQSYDEIADAATRSGRRVEKANQGMRSSFRTLSGAVRAAGAAFGAAFTGRAVVQGVQGVADELDRLGKTADRLNIDPNDLAALEFAADRSGIALSKMSAAIETLQKRTGEALLGVGEARKAFDRLGISAASFADLNADEQLELLADALSGVASEEERAALASQLFSKANIDLLQVLNEGGPALRALVDQGKAFRTVTEEQTQAAAAYNDALTNLRTAIQALGFQQVPPVLNALTEFLNLRGFGTPVDVLAARLRALEDQLDTPLLLRLFGIGGIQTDATINKQIEAVTSELLRLQIQSRKNELLAEREAETRLRQQRANKDYETTLEDLTGAYEDQAKALSQSLNAQTDELRTARTQQAKIEQEFQGLVDNIMRPDIEEVGLGDVFGKINQAAAKAEQGQADEAIAIAREGGRFLELLAEKGTESDLVLKFLGDRLADVAQKASQQKVDTELVDQRQVEEAIAGVQEKLAALKSDAAIQGAEAGRAFVEALRLQLEGAPVTLPPIDVTNSGQQAAQTLASQVEASLAQAPPAAPASSQPRREPRIVREGNSFFYSYMREKEQRGAK